MPFYRLRTSWVPSRSPHSKSHVSLNRLLLMIAEMFGLTQRAVSEILDDRKKGQMSQISKDFSPPLYNIAQTSGNFDHKLNLPLPAARLFLSVHFAHFFEACTGFEVDEMASFAVPALLQIPQNCHLSGLHLSCFFDRLHQGFQRI